MPFFGTEQQYISPYNISAKLLLEKSASKKCRKTLNLQNMKNLEMYGVLEMNTLERAKINGGSTCPTYDIKDNYDAAEDQGETIVTFAFGFFKGFFKTVFDL